MRQNPNALIFELIDTSTQERHMAGVTMELVDVLDDVLCLELRDVMDGEHYHYMRGDLLPLTPAAKKFLDEVRYE